MASLEQVRAIFDASEIGIVLIGMPGIEKRLARYAQFYSRIGFVHEFRPLGTTEIRRLLAQRWTPAGVNLPEQPWAEEVIAAIIRVTRRENDDADGRSLRGIRTGDASGGDVVALVSYPAWRTPDQAQRKEHLSILSAEHVLLPVYMLPWSYWRVTIVRRPR